MQSRTHLKTVMAVVLMAGGISACGHIDAEPITPGPRPTANFSNIGYADWSESEPSYRFYPGDEIEVATPTAPELTRTLKVGPDGRIALPLIGQVMAADRTLFELENSVSGAYASQLVRPVVEVTLKQAGPMKVWVTGEVRNPNVYDMPGDIDALQAVIISRSPVKALRSLPAPA